MQDSRVLRSIQTGTSVNNGSGYTPINATYPVVKPTGDHIQRKRAGSEAPSDTAKRMKGGGLGLMAVNELLGKPTNTGDSAQPATDFSTFNAFLRGQPGSAPGPVASQGQGSKLAAALQLTTFNDVMTNGEAPQQAAKNTQALEAQKVTMLSVSYANQSRPAEQAGAQPVASTSGEQAALREFRAGQCMPYDWCLKKAVRFLSLHKFGCYTAATRVSYKQCLEGYKAALAGTWHTLMPEEKWQAALVSWQHPEASWDTETVSSLSRVKTTSKVLVQRLDAWRQAFASAYMAVRHGHSSALYVCSPEEPRDKDKGVKHPMSVVFTSVGACSTSSPRALVSSSTKLLRSRMVAGGLEFSMPLVPVVSRVAASKGGGGEDQEDITSQAAQLQAAASVPNGKPQSMLLFEGPQAVHMLFDFLMAETNFESTVFGETAADVPLLLAPVPFEGAALHRLQVKSVSLLCGPEGGPQHVLDIAGPVAPWTLTRMCAALQDMCAAAPDGGHEFHMEALSFEHCLGLNVRDTRSRHGGEREGRPHVPFTAECACLVQGEVQAAATLIPELQQRTIKGAVYDPQQRAFIVRSSAA